MLFNNKIIKKIESVEEKMKSVLFFVTILMCVLMAGCDLDIDLVGSGEIKPLEKMPDPVANITSGVYPVHQSISLSCEIPNANIYYTLDGTDPTINSLCYTQAFEIYQNTTLKVIAMRNNYSPSDIKTYEYTFNFPTATAPLISPSSGMYQDVTMIEITSTLAGAEIHYTTDGSRPELNSNRYTSPFAISKSMTIRARAFKMDYNPSEVSCHTFEIIMPLDMASMIYVPAGYYLMGSQNGFDDERPVHEVYVSAYYLSDRPVTQFEWQQLMGSNPSNTNYGIGSNYPINNVSWIDALKYCNKRSIQEGLTPCYMINQEVNPDNWPSNYPYSVWYSMECNWSADGYRLPTEAEREFAARGSNQSQSYNYAGSNNIEGVAWYFNNSNGTSHPVAMKNPNELGIFDMSGNVWEWCWDTYVSYYSSDTQVNPTGPEANFYKVVRGGCWGNPEMSCRVSARDGYSLKTKEYFIGFRVARTRYTIK